MTTLTPERERRREVHAQIVALRQRGYSLMQIAIKVGLQQHSSVRHHLTGRCQCNGKTDEAAEPSGGDRV